MGVTKQPHVQDVHETKFDVKQFNTQFVRWNKPVVVRQMSLDWGSTKYWNFEYLTEKAGETSLLYQNIIKKKDQLSTPWSMAKQVPIHSSASFGKVLELISKNSETSRDAQRPTLTFVNDEVIRGTALRGDYEFPYLH